MIPYIKLKDKPQPGRNYCKAYKRLKMRNTLTSKINRKKVNNPTEKQVLKI